MADTLADLRAAIERALEVTAQVENDRCNFGDVLDSDLALLNSAKLELETALSALSADMERMRGAMEPEFGPDTDGPVNFYERDFYPLSNFSAFTLFWRGIRFDTSEAAYHWEKFCDNAPGVAMQIERAASAHEAFKLAEEGRQFRRLDWDDVKVDIMRRIIRSKAGQHEYVRRKLLATGDRPLVEGSWRDDFWGAGPDGNGQNVLGKLWMELRTELRAALQPKDRNHD